MTPDEVAAALAARTPRTEAGKRLLAAIQSGLVGLFADDDGPDDPSPIPAAIVAIEREAADPLWRVAEAARFHNKTPSGATRACLDGCIACAALADLDATREEMP